MENKKPEKTNYNFRPMNRSPVSLWKILIGLVLIWIIFSFLFRGFGNNESVSIPYSKFKNEVVNANIKKVTIKGQNINGQFKSSYTKVEGKDTLSYNYFTTIIPSVNDPDLMKSLEDNNVTINAETEGGNSWLTYLLIMGLPWILILGYFFYMRSRVKNQMGNMMGGGGLFGIGRSGARRIKKEKVSVGFNDVAGLENAKTDLREIIDYLKEPQRFSKLGADIPKGILLMGPPGTGKTLLARATAGEANVAFFSISGSEFIEMFVGVGASRVRDLFNNAKQNAPSVIFIDEIDSIGRSRGTGLGGGHDEREQTLNQILSEMDGFETNESVVVMAATNRPDVLDPALIRPGRFDRRITLELPLREARKKILEIHTRHVPLDDDVNLGNIAARTISFSGADIKNLVNEAALLAGRKNKQKVAHEDFEEARDKILLGEEREEIISDEEKKVIAYHEAGHTLVAELIEGADPLEKVTIIPRGRTLGVTEQMPEIERYNYKKKYLMAKLAITLGGRASEKIVFDDYSNGAASDFKAVTNLARKMICLWGMSDKLGPVYYRQGEDHLFLGKEIAQSKNFSEHTQQIIDEEIEKIIKESEERAIKLLKDNRVKLDALAEGLLENETMDRDQIKWLLDKVDKGEEVEA